MKKLIAIAVAGAVGLSGLVISNFAQDNRPVLKVANWAEYIDPGDSEEDINSLVEDFEIWYQEVTGKPIRVEYCIADDNEILYNMLKMGDHFDLICPSEYMLMKLAAEGSTITAAKGFPSANSPRARAYSSSVICRISLRDLK